MAKTSPKTAAQTSAKPRKGAAQPAHGPTHAPRGSLFELETLPDEIIQGALTSGGYPYDKKMKAKRYDKELLALQIELLKFQAHVRDKGERLVVVFEGRDAAGKGGTIHRITQHLNPRSVRVVALAKPTEAEHGQWYFQRYIQHLPTKGEIVLFDRSWYNRAGVERVMGFCTKQETNDFLDDAPRFERMLVDSGITLVKFWLDVGKEMQIVRLHARMRDPLKRWKLSPIDFESQTKWDDYSKAADKMFEATHTDDAPWTVVRANDKRRTRLGVIRTLLNQIDYDGRDEDVVGEADPAIVLPASKFSLRAQDRKG